MDSKTNKEDKSTKLQKALKDIKVFKEQDWNRPLEDAKSKKKISRRSIKTINDGYFNNDDDYITFQKQRQIR